MAARSRVCAPCGAPPAAVGARPGVGALGGLGGLTQAAQALAPDRGGSFLIVARRLKLCGLSRGAERLLAVVEPAAVHRHIGEFLEPADAEAGPNDALVQAITMTAAAGGALPAPGLVVRPAGEYGVRYAARVGSCGPPAGALIVLDVV